MFANPEGKECICIRDFCMAWKTTKKENNQAIDGYCKLIKYES